MEIENRKILKGEALDLVNAVIPVNHGIESADFENDRLVVIHGPTPGGQFKKGSITKTTIHRAADGCIKFFSEDAG
tara:strand:- start:2658 stop:2885 length:228 start_codon:yes stop_codon:yes gene_type:complete